MFVDFNMTKSSICKDCKTALHGIYCHVCGQKDSNPFYLKSILSEFLDSFFSMDSKLFLTLKNMIIKPGFLTTEYWKGKRSRCISPMKIYIVMSFIMFALLPFSLQFLNDGKGGLFEASENDQLPSGYTGIGVFTEVIKTLEEGGDIGIANLLKDGIYETQRREITAEQIFFSAIPTSMFVLMPFFAVLLYLILFRNKKLTYIHHLITVLHLHSTVFILLLIFLFFEYLGLHNIFDNILLLYFWPIFSIVCLSYFMKNVYDNSWISTVIKSIVLSSIYAITFFFATFYIMFFAMTLFGQPS